MGKITELQSAVETIKLWSFLAGDSNRTKEEYFKDTNTKKIPFAGCHYCEFYLGNNRTFDFESTQQKCSRVRCPLATNKLCNFCERGSAYDIWLGLREEIFKGDNIAKRERIRCAKLILSAAKRHYKKLTGEDYHER